MNVLTRSAILLVLSLAARAHAADPVTLSIPGHKAMGPEIAVATDGSINVVWLERTPEGEAIAAAGAASAEGHTHLAQADVFFARSTDGGKTFTAPSRVNDKTGSVWGFTISKPRVLVGRDGVIHVLYPGNASSPKSGAPIVLSMYTRSTDNGRSFATPVSLGTVPQTDNSSMAGGGLANAECFGTLALDDRGGVYAYWIDTRDMSKDSPNGKVFSAISLDNGRSFGKDFEVFPAEACPCCQLTATVHDGRIYVGLRQVSAEGNRESAIAISSDRGRTFTPRVRWGGAPWKIEGCPLKPTSLAVDGKYVYMTAFNGGADPQGAYFSRSTDGGKSFQPAMLLHPGAAISDAPAVTLLDDRIVVAWHAKVGSERRVYTSVSLDHGATFSAPAQVPAPAGSGTHPVIATRAGGIQIVWQLGDAVVTRHLAAAELQAGGRVATAQ
jgi:hypothetical protein